MIIGLTGSLAAGKGTTAKYLVEKYGGQTVKFSDPLRDILKRIYQVPTRESLSELAVYLRSKFGQDILIQTLLKDIEAKGEGIFILDGLRYREEYDVLSGRDDFHLWALDTELETRYRRIIQREENESDKSLTLEQFKAQHELATEQFTPELMKKAETTFDNNGTAEELYAQVDAAIKKLLA